jgi:mono/diheme cytochrome c family protein
LRTIKVGIVLAFIAAISIGCLQETGPNFLEGQEIYKTYCVACHGVNGGGVLYNKSALNNDVFVTGDPKEVIAVILYGREGAGTMPGWKMMLNDQEVAAVATYIRQAWSNRADSVPSAMVTEVKTKREKRVSQPTQ